MIENKKPSNNFQKIDPDDFENYEEQFVDKGGGGGKTSGHKGKKTIHALKEQQRNQSVEQRRKVVEDSLIQVLSNFPKPLYIEPFCLWCNYPRFFLTSLRGTLTGTPS